MSASQLNVYTSGQRNSATVAGAFARGAKLPLLRLPAPLALGGMATFGDGHGLRPVLEQAIADGREWIYIDNGYFRRGHFDGHYRVTRNAYQHDGSGEEPARHWRRFDALAVGLKPWQRHGSFVLVCPPDADMMRRGVDGEAWLRNALAVLAAHTERSLIVRRRPRGAAAKADPLERALIGAHALVTHSSNAAVEALIAGVPVFCTDPCAAYRMGSPDLTKIETPRYPEERPGWAWNLAANQWTLAEMESGRCWAELRERSNA